MDLRDVSIGIVGGGTVGRAIANAYSGHVKTVKMYDIDEKKATHPFISVACCDFIFVCVPTPNDPETGLLNIHAVREVLGKLTKHSNVILKSTVPIGTTKKMREEYGLTNLVYSPEFLTSRTAMIDAQMPRVNIIGTDNAINAREVVSLYYQRYRHVPMLMMGTREAEAIKL